MSDETRNLPLQYRAMTITQHRGGQPDAPAELSMSLSSETPVERWGWDGVYDEVLDHTPAAVDLSRAANGLPLLLDHDVRRQVGRLQEVRLEEGRLVGRPVFSRSAVGQETEQDVRDGIRQEVSVGYRVLSMDLIGKDAAGKPTYRCAWMPYEATLTAVPADPTVGVGRDADRAAFPVVVSTPDQPAPKAEERSMADEKEPAPGTGTARVHEDARQEMADIAGLCAANGASHRVAEFIQKGMTREQVKGVLFDEAVEKGKSAPKMAPDLSEGERRRYSFQRAIAGAMQPSTWNGLEREVSAEIAKRAGKEGSQSLFIPTDLEVRALSAGGSGSGTEFKFTAPKPFIELLREKTVTRALGATYLTGLGAPVAFPRQTVAGSASWRTENPGSDLSDADSTYDTLALAPKTIQRGTAFTRQMVFQASEDIENIVRNDLAAVLALAWDLAGIAGTGASNQPQGVLYNTNVSTVTLGANAGTITYAGLVGLERAIAINNADIGRLGVLTNGQQRAQARQVQQFSGTNGVPLWVGGANGGAAQMAVGEVLGPNGYPAFVSQQVPANLTKGTSTTICSAWVMANWAELYMAEFGAMELIVDPFSKKKQALIELTAIMYGDVGLRHPKSFAAIYDAL